VISADRFSGSGLLSFSSSSFIQSFLSVTFDADSKWSRIAKEAFRWNGSMAIHVPSSVEVLCEKHLMVRARSFAQAGLS
jgi:hypothetical protein